MAKDARPIPLDLINECLIYDPIYGNFIWKVRPEHHFKSNKSMKIFNTQFAGKTAGHLGRDGYVMIRALNKPWLAHRLAWSIFHNKPIPPDLCIDHINWNRSDNRIVNLRAVTAEINNRNMRLDVRNTSGKSGVYFCKNKEKWASQIHLFGKHMHLGYFVELSDAISAREKAEKENGFHENHGCKIAAL